MVMRSNGNHYEWIIIGWLIILLIVINGWLPLILIVNEWLTNPMVEIISILFMNG